MDNSRSPAKRGVSGFAAALLVGVIICVRATSADLPQITELRKSTYGHLDALLQSKNWNGLGVALTPRNDPAPLAISMDWLHERIGSGGPYFLTVIYARDLWDVGVARNSDDPTTDMRVTSAMITLYAYELIQIDGAECEDRTALTHRFDQLIQARIETLRYLKSRPQRVKDWVFDIAVAFERKTAPLRAHNDELLCRGGMEEMMAGINAGRTQELPNPQGYYGRQMGVSPPPDWQPKFLPPNIYEPGKIEARADMRQKLEKFIEGLPTEQLMSK